MKKNDNFLQEQLALLGSEFSEIYEAVGEVEQAAFLRFANALGCFSREPMLDDQGRPTKIVMGQKASSTLRRFLQADPGTQNSRNMRLHLGEFTALCRNLPEIVTPNQNFLNFISHSVNNYGLDQFPNLELLLDLERGHEIDFQDGEAPICKQPPHPGLFVKAMTNFDLLERLSLTLNQRQIPQHQLRKNALLELYQRELNRTYPNVTPEDQPMADLFAMYDIPEEIFKNSAGVYGVARAAKVPAHILGQPLQDDPQAGYEFRYEMLDKYDPHNPIIGLFCSCCAILGNHLYGGAITETAILADNIQNLVIRNGRNDIISKGTVCIDTQQHKAVINDFELNSGYISNTNRKQITQREQIFAAYLRGINAIVTRYNTIHPEHPLEAVNVGSGHNKLMQLCEQYPVATADQHIYVDYNFKDSNHEKQFVLYQRPREMSLEQ